jgi:MraZ protein
MWAKLRIFGQISTELGSIVPDWESFMPKNQASSGTHIQLYAQFSGHSQVTVDQKGRISIPIKFRNLLSPESREGLMLMRGLEQCIYAYPLDEWDRLTRIFETHTKKLGTKYRFNRRWAMPTTQAPFDPQGRVPLPQTLRSYARIEDVAVVGGAVDHLEIWNPDLWQQDIEEGEPEFAEMFKNIIVGAQPEELAPRDDEQSQAQ